MGYNSRVSGHPKSTEIPRIDGLSMRPLDLGRHKKSNMIYNICSTNIYVIITINQVITSF